MTSLPFRMSTMSRRRLSQFFSNYGMLLVLLLLCAYYSVVTMEDQNPRGLEAAEALIADLTGTLDPGTPVVVATKASSGDRQFATLLADRLEAEGYPVAQTIQGDPRIVRLALDSLAAAGTSIGAIATTLDFATIVNNVRGQIPAFAEVPVLAPESYRWPTFLRANNLRNVANQIVVIAVIAVGMTMVIITAGIDLSVGSLIALSAVVAAYLIQAWGGADAGFGVMLAASLAAIGLCGLVGLFSGLVITQFKVPPFIATLGVMQIASGLAYIISQGRSISDIPPGYVWLGRGADFFSIPNAVLLMVVIYAAAHLLMTRTTLGRYIYAVGGNEEAARLSGIRVNWVLLFVYLMSGLLAGLGGIVQASQLNSGAPTYGLMYELYVIAAVVIGGTSLFGGEGKILGTLIGAFIIAVIQNGMNLTGVESYTQKVVLGFVILGAVLLDMLKKRGWRFRRLQVAG